MSESGGRYNGPERRASSTADQHIADAISEALTRLVSLSPKIDHLDDSVKELRDQNTANRRKITLIAIAVTFGFLTFISSLVILARVNNSVDEAKNLTAFIEDCINPEGECFKRNTLASRERNRATLEALDAGQRTVECLLLIEPGQRTEESKFRCRQEAREGAHEARLAAEALEDQANLPTTTTTTIEGD